MRVEKLVVHSALSITKQDEKTLEYTLRPTTWWDVELEEKDVKLGLVGITIQFITLVPMMSRSFQDIQWNDFNF